MRLKPMTCAKAAVANCVLFNRSALGIFMVEAGLIKQATAFVTCKSFVKFGLRLNSNIIYF